MRLNTNLVSDPSAKLFHYGTLRRPEGWQVEKQRKDFEGLAVEMEKLRQLKAGLEGNVVR